MLGEPRQLWKRESGRTGKKQAIINGWTRVLRRVDKLWRAKPSRCISTGRTGEAYEVKKTGRESQKIARETSSVLESFGRHRFQFNGLWLLYPTTSRANPPLRASGCAGRGLGGGPRPPPPWLCGSGSECGADIPGRCWAASCSHVEVVHGTSLAPRGKFVMI